MSRLRVGDSLDKAVDIGAIVDESQLKTVEEYVEQARKEGAEVLTSTFPRQLLQIIGCLCILYFNNEPRYNDPASSAL